MIDIQSQMLDALEQLRRFLAEPLEDMNPKVRELCLGEVIKLTSLTQRSMIMPNPDDRDDLILRHCLNREALPLPVAVLAERYLELYEKTPLPPHEQPILDYIETESNLPLVRARNLVPEKLHYQASTLGKDLIWTTMILNVDLRKDGLAERLWADHMVKCFEEETQPLAFSLFTRWDLGDQIPQFAQQHQLGDSIYIALKKDVPAANFLLHLQFLLNTWVELNEDRDDLSLKEGILTYAMDQAADTFAELMPPLSQIVVYDLLHGRLYHFGSPLERVHWMLHEYAN